MEQIRELESEELQVEEVDEESSHDDDRILERQRYQIEQIWELESEELQVEEVDGESSDDDQTNSGGASASGVTYDTSLAALHSYLGDVEDTHNRLAFLDGGAVFNVPLFYVEGVVLFPEATLPLRVIQPNFIASVERALRQVDAPYTIGVIRIYRDPNNRRRKLATTGTTAETLIARRSDMLVMSSEGPLGSYVNPRGFAHETMTLFKVNGLAIIGNPVEEYSWFPGYAWSIAQCATCETQSGWLFTATKKKLKPTSFWGILSSQVADDSR